MPDLQEAIALGIVAVIAGRLLWRRWARRKAPATGGKAGACGDCAAAGPPPKEATLHFHRHREAEGPPAGSSGD